jgi:primosomal replication protein N
LAGVNHVKISGRLIELEGLRYSPAGIPIVQFRVSHESEQLEAGVTRKVNCELGVIAVEREARLVASAKLGVELVATGFLDHKSRSGTQFILHATHIEFKNQD